MRDPTDPPAVGCEKAGTTPSPTRDDWLMRNQTGLLATGRGGWRNAFVVDSALNGSLGGHDYFAQYGFNNL